MEIHVKNHRKIDLDLEFQGRKNFVFSCIFIVFYTWQNFSKEPNNFQKKNGKKASSEF